MEEAYNKIVDSYFCDIEISEDLPTIPYWADSLFQSETEFTPYDEEEIE